MLPVWDVVRVVDSAYMCERYPVCAPVCLCFHQTPFSVCMDASFVYVSPCLPVSDWYPCALHFVHVESVLVITSVMACDTNGMV